MEARKVDLAVGGRPLWRLLAFVTKREEIARFAKVIGKKAEEDAVIWIGLRFGFGAPSS